MHTLFLRSRAMKVTHGEGSRSSSELEQRCLCLIWMCMLKMHVRTVDHCHPPRRDRQQAIEAYYLVLGRQRPSQHKAVHLRVFQKN